MRHNPRILLAEDNPGDADLVAEILRAKVALVEVVRVVDGEQATEYLLRGGDRDGPADVDLVILDLNLPKVSGHGVLREVRRHQALRTLPVVVLTSSDSQRDILRSYELGANCFLTKPGNLSRFTTVVEAIEAFWLRVVTLPA